MSGRKNLKRIFAFFLSVTMILSMSMTVFAEDGDDIENGSEFSVCELKEGCTLEAGHEGDCVVEADKNDADGEKENGNIAQQTVKTNQPSTASLDDENGISGQSDEPVAEVDGTTYTTLREAVEQAGDGATITLLRNADVDAVNGRGIVLGKSLVFNLNGNTITGDASCSYVCLVQNDSVSVTFQNGVIIGTNTTPGSYGIKMQGGTLRLDGVTVKMPTPNGTSAYNYAVNGGAFLDAGYQGAYDSCAIEMNNCSVVEYNKDNVPADNTYGVVGVTIWGDTTTSAAQNELPEGNNKLIMNNCKVDVNGFAVSGNGSQHGTYIEINNSELISNTSTGVYHPQYGTINISGSTITGYNAGVEVRAGVLNMESGIVKGTNSPTDVAPNGSGTTSTGAGIAISQHSTKLPINVNITGGTVEGYSAVYESNPQNNEQAALDKISLNISGGEFNAITGGTQPVYSENFEGFISGGVFSHNVSEDYCDEGYTSVMTVNGDGKYVVVSDEQKADAEDVSEQMKDLPAAGDVKASDADAIRAAKAAYDSLSDAQKALISDEDKAKLDAAVAALEALEQTQPDKNNGNNNGGNNGSANQGTNVVKDKGAVKTGDSANLMLWIVMTMLAIGTVTGVAAVKRRRNYR